eukprot:jgi/Tetstr1/435641/TSEL_024541.t1
MLHRTEVRKREAALCAARDPALQDGDKGANALVLARVDRRVAHEAQVRELAPVPVGDGCQPAGDGGRGERAVARAVVDVATQEAQSGGEGVAPCAVQKEQ